MSSLLKILNLEDNLSDAKLIEIELKKSKLDFTFKHVKTRGEFTDAINTFKPDLILSDYTLPQFSGIEALGISLNLCPQIPFIIVTATLNEEIAVECIRLGAWDYVLKGNLVRLIPAIENALKLKTEKELIKSNNIINRSPVVAISWKNTKNWSVEYISENVKEILGYLPTDFLSNKIKYSEIIHPDDIKRVSEEVKIASNNKDIKNFNHKPYRLITKNKKTIWVDDKTRIIRNAKSEITHYEGILHNISQQVIDNKLLTIQKEEYEDLSEEYLSQNDKLKESIVKTKESEKKYRSILNNSKDAIIISSTNYKLQYKNPAAIKQMENNTNSDYCYTALFGFKEKCTWCAFSSMKKDEVVEKEIQHPITKKNYIVDFSYLKNEDDTYSFMSVYKDITELRKAEEEKNKLLQSLEASFNEIYLFDTQNLKFEYINEATVKNLGYSKEEILNLSVLDIKKELTEIEFKKIINPLISGEKNKITFIAIHKRKDNTSYPVELQLQLIKQNSNKYFLAVGNDITEKLKEEKKLLEKSQQIETIFNNTKDIFYSIDIKTNKVLQISPACNEIFGYSQEDFYNNSNLITEIIHHEDKSYAKINKDEFKNGKTITNNYRIINSKGEIKWVTNKMSPQFNKEKLILINGSISDTTEKTILEISLKEASDINKKIIEASKLGVAIYNKNGDCILANDNIVKIIGGKKEQILSENFRKLESWEKSGILKDAEKCLKTNKEIKRISHITTSFGKTLWLETHFSTYESENETKLLLLARDISQLKNAEKEIALKAEELRSLIETVNNPIFRINTNGYIDGWNKSAEKISGYKEKEVLNKSFVKKLFDKKTQENVNNIIINALKGYEVENYEFNLKTKTGKYLKILLNTTAHRDVNGNIKGVICAGQDITKLDKYRSKLEKKVKKRTKKLKKALNNEKELSELKSRFVSMASHEFRTPLSAINFAAGFLKKYSHKLDDKTKEKKLLKIETQVMHMTSLLDDVLTIGKLDANQIKYKPEYLDFSKFISSIIEEVENSNKNTHKIKIYYNCKKNKIFIDEKLGRKIFTNLFSNAIKFSPDKNYIELYCDCDNEKWIFKVIDFGIGINKKDLENIFDPFTRGNNVETIQGTGLGLAIVKESIDLMKGKITVESEVGKGTTFTISLPFD